jgi:hypothetical protein
MTRGGLIHAFDTFDFASGKCRDTRDHFIGYPNRAQRAVLTHNA